MKVRCNVVIDLEVPEGSKIMPDGPLDWCIQLPTGEFIEPYGTIIQNELMDDGTIEDVEVDDPEDMGVTITVWDIKSTEEVTP